MPGFEKKGRGERQRGNREESSRKRQERWEEKVKRQQEGERGDIMNFLNHTNAVYL